MSIYAFVEVENGRPVRVNARAEYPSVQDGNIFFDADFCYSEREKNTSCDADDTEENIAKIGVNSHKIDLKYDDELPVRMDGCYSLVAFRPSHIFLSRDVLGGKPLYYNPFTLTFSSFKNYFSEQPIELLPGETLKIGYDGSIISKRKFAFEEVFSDDFESSGVIDFENGNGYACKNLKTSYSGNGPDLLIEKVEESLKKFPFNRERTCVAFSGGVDSSLLASFYDLPLISVTASKKEEDWVKYASKELGMNLELMKFNEKDIMDAIPKVISSIESTDTLQVSIAVPVFLAMNLAKNLGYNRVIFGQGADELFGGYKRYEMMDDVELKYELEKDILNIGNNNLVRDTKLSYRSRIKMLTPYLQWDVIQAAINIPPEWKVRRGNGVIRKFALRKLASKYIPEEIANRDKKAVQYSTETTALLMKLARREGLKMKEWLRSVK